MSSALEQLCPHCGGTGKVATATDGSVSVIPRPQDIVLFIARRYTVPHPQLTGRGRRAIIRRPRRIAMWLLRTAAGLSLPEIGRVFSKADHTSALAACRRVEAERIESPAFRKETDDLVAALHAQYPALPIGPRHPLAALVASGQSSADA